MRSPLAAFAARPPADDDQLRAMRVAAWREQGVIVVRPSEIRDLSLRQKLVDLANQLFGRSA